MRNRYCSHTCHHKVRTDLPEIARAAAQRRWGPGGVWRTQYVARVKAKLNAFVPQQGTFTRMEVLRILSHYGAKRYHDGWAARTERMLDEQAAVSYQRRLEAWRQPA